MIGDPFGSFPGSVRGRTKHDEKTYVGTIGTVCRRSNVRDSLLSETQEVTNGIRAGCQRKIGN